MSRPAFGVTGKSLAPGREMYTQQHKNTASCCSKKLRQEAVCL